MHAPPQPFNLQLEISSLSGRSSVEFREFSELEFKQHANDLSAKMSSDCRCLLNHSEFVLFKVMLERKLSQPQLQQYIEIIAMGLSLFANSISSSLKQETLFRELLEKYLYLAIASIGSPSVSVEEFKGSADSCTTGLLLQIAKIINYAPDRFQKIWSNAGASEANSFFASLFRILNLLLDRSVGKAGSPYRCALVACYGALLRNFSNWNAFAQECLLQEMQRLEGVGDVVGEIVVFLASNDIGGGLSFLDSFFTSGIESFLATIADFSSQASADQNGSEELANGEIYVKNWVRLLLVAAKDATRELLRHFSFVSQLFASENHQLRCAVLECIGAILLKGELELSETAFGSLLNSVIERCLDVNAFVRSRALSTIGEVCRAGLLPAALLQSIWVLAQDRLRDKASIVRKKSLILLTDLIRSHPFHFDGGELNTEFFTERLSSISETLETGEKAGEKTESLDTLVIQRKYYADALAFATAINESMQYICDHFLFASFKTEVVEAIEFLITCYNYRVFKANLILIRMLPLVWCRDSTGDDENRRSVRENFLQSLQFLFLDGCTTAASVQNLVSFCAACNLQQFLGCMEEILDSFVSKKLITKAMIMHMWNAAFADGESAPNRCVLLAILHICCRGDDRKQLLVSHIPSVLKLISPKEFVLCFHVLRLLQSLQSEDFRSEAARQAIIDGAVKVIDEYATTSCWVPAVERAIEVIYRCSADPESVAKEIICKAALGEKTHFSVAKLLLILGTVATKQSTRLYAVESLLKSSAKQAMQTSSASSSVDEVVGRNASPFDLVSDYVSLLRETELLLSTGKDDSLLTAFADLPRAVLSSTNADLFLQRMAAFCLCKFCAVSEEFCKKNLSLFLHLLTTTRDPLLQSTLAIAFGDLASAFSGLIDSKLSYLYELLLPSVALVVRRNALNTICYLILNGMTKVKGNLHLIAQCLHDRDEKICHQTRNFFLDFAVKDANAIYNNLPDVISNLSESRRTASREVEFEGIMRWLFSLLKKDRQSTNIAEKLIARLCACNRLQTCADLAFCLSLLFSAGCDRVVGRIVEVFAKELAPKFCLLETSSEFMHAERMLQCFRDIAQRSKRSAVTAAQSEQLENFLNSLSIADQMQVDSLPENPAAKAVPKRKAK